MVRNLTATLAVVALLLAPGWARAADPVKEGARLIDKRLRELGAAGYAILPLSDDCASRAFPEALLYAVRFRQYPVAVAPPEGLAPSNLFAVKGGELQAGMTGPDDLQRYFFNHLAPAAKAADAQVAACAYLRLTQEFVQDGFYAFRPAEVGGVQADEDGNGWVSGQVEVKSGGRGKITATLYFYADGTFAGAEEKVSVLAGIRPICQATKLLDADPVVRKMAEQDLLIMGRAAKGYLDEQRKKASPELRKAIDKLWRRIAAEE
jgi:hypothetical protein